LCGSQHTAGKAGVKKGEGDNQKKEKNLRRGHHRAGTENRLLQGYNMNRKKKGEEGGKEEQSGKIQPEEKRGKMRSDRIGDLGWRSRTSERGATKENKEKHSKGGGGGGGGGVGGGGRGGGGGGGERCQKLWEILHNCYSCQNCRFGLLL